MVVKGVDILFECFVALKGKSGAHFMYPFHSCTARCAGNGFVFPPGQSVHVQEREPVTYVSDPSFGEPTTIWHNVNHPILPNKSLDLS
ncbi:hypothetical protein CHARACLAT_020992 [Characodon lateralis]|uniref:Uncharacterized protein n=1 Tax=Characodon lateralis TaxID=208331 RepID=A0ABU7D2V5_9TELE|nr:hypothetical protein [Characodon lateralis]